MVLNRINVYVIMRINVQNLALYLSGTQENVPPPPPSFCQNYFLPYIPQKYTKIGGNCTV